MKCKETKHLEQEMTSAVEAHSYVVRMVAKETKGWGDTIPALERIQTKYGLPFWTLNHIRIGRAKTVDGGMLRRIKAAYYAALKIRERAGEVTDVELQRRYALAPHGVHVAFYVADFVFFDRLLRRRRIVDVKGFETKEFKMKRKLMKACFGADIEVVK